LGTGPAAVVARMQQCSGIVKSNGFQRGYGFISSDQLPGQDVYFQKRDLPAELCDLNTDDIINITGRQVMFLPESASDGKPQAKSIQVYTTEGEDVIGLIKSYNQVKGYGFITTSMIQGDVYFKSTDMPAVAQQCGDVKGLQVKFSSALAKDGKVQARALQVIGGSTLAGVQGSAIAAGQVPIPGGGMQQMQPLGMGQVQGMGQMQGMRPAMGQMQGMRPAMGQMQGMRPGMGQMQGMGQAMGQMGMGQMGMAQAKGGMMMAGKGQMMAGKGMMAGGVGMMGMKGGMMGMPGMAAPGQLPEGTPLSGMVKSFDPIKGYGFIVLPNFPVDVFFKGDGNGLVKGQEVSFTLKYSKDGRPQGENVAPPMQAGDTCVGRVKRYNPAKGFGFLAVEGKPQDVYFQKKDLTEDLQEQNLDGAEMQFTVKLTSDGKPQAQDMILMNMPVPGEKRPGDFDGGEESAAKRQRTEMAPFGGAGFNLNDGAFAAPVAGGSYTGTVKSYNAVKSFGFITCPSVAGDVWFRSSSLPQDLQQMSITGMQVTFDLQFAADGKPQASNVNI